MTQLLALSASAVLIFSLGCGGDTSTRTGGEQVTPPATGDVQAHPSEGPHHGTLVELGNEEYHAEVWHDTTSVTVYLLDSSAKTAVPIDADEVTINLVHAGLPEQFKLAANPELSDPSGRSSRFTLADAELAKHMDDASANPKLTLTIDGTSYRGEIEHDHGHSGHDHDH